MNFIERDTALTKNGANWKGHVSPHWSIGTNPNGGYLTTIAARALHALAPHHPDPLSITTHYLRPGIGDAPCEVTAELIRSGRTTTTSRATLIQDGKPRIEVMASFGDLAQVSESAPDSKGITLPPPNLPPVDACPVHSGAEQGIDLPLLDRLDICIHPDQFRAGAAGEPVVSGYIRFRDESPPEPTACIVFSDAFPSSVFGSHGLVGWVPTIELTVHVRRRAEPGWLRGLFRTDDLNNGMLVESGALWDSRGHLVAQSRQIALLLQRQ